jgi:hypothetical protein
VIFLKESKEGKDIISYPFLAYYITFLAVIYFDIISSKKGYVQCLRDSIMATGITNQNADNIN